MFIKNISQKTKKKEEMIIEEIKKNQQEKNITYEVAALLVGKKYDASLTEFFKEIEQSLFSK